MHRISHAKAHGVCGGAASKTNWQLERIQVGEAPFRVPRSMSRGEASLANQGAQESSSETGRSGHVMVLQCGMWCSFHISHGE